MDEQKVLFSGEAQLIAWGESNSAGAWVKMWIHPDDLEYFKVMKARTGKTPGQRLGVAIVAISDDEQIVEHQPVATPAPAPAAPKQKPGDLAMCAVLWCKMPEFRVWARQYSGIPVTDEDDAKEFILDEAGANAKYGRQASRKHLDADHDCGRAFLDRVFYPFTDWAKANGVNLGKPRE